VSNRSLLPCQFTDIFPLANSSVPTLHAQQQQIESSRHDPPWVTAAAAAISSAARMADPPPGDPAWEDTPFLYAANMHNSMEALLDTEYQTAYLQSNFVNPANIPEDINVDDDETSQALKLIAEAARVNRLIRHPVERIIAPFAGMARLAERMIDPLKQEYEEVKKNMVLEEKAVTETNSLIRDIERGIL
jgi:hypothetical protein